MVRVTTDWFVMLKEKYGKEHPRLTELRNFDTIVASKVVEANEKLYINREEGFIGTSLKKDEFVANCSDIDDVIIFYRDGKYKVVRISDKMFVGKNVLYVNIFKKNDKRTVYNVVYRDGKDGVHFMKRFAVTSITRDREYDVTQGTPGSRIVYFTANPNGEAEVIKVTLKPNPRLKKIVLEKDFSEIAIKGRQSMGNILTKNEVHKISLKQRGGSTLGGRQVWFDRDVLRLNYDGRGEFLGEFHSEDSILIINQKNEFYTTDFDLNNHYEPDILLIEKFNPEKIWTAVLYDAEQQGYPYIKRFTLEKSSRKQNFLGENKENKLILLSGEAYPRIQLLFGGKDSFREPLIIDAEEFIGLKSFKAKGKRATTFEVSEFIELEPVRFAPKPKEEPEETVAETEAEVLNEDPDAGKSQSDLIDEITGQMKLFD
jgi:topoisomerase-4 subunit A